MEAVIERFFKVSERGSSLGTEVMAGLTTFLTMAYIVAVNPAMMEAAGIPFKRGAYRYVLRRGYHDGGHGPYREPAYRAGVGHGHQRHRGLHAVRFDGA